MSASGIKPWQWVLMAVALVVLSVSVWRSVFAGDRPELPDRLTLVDIATGSTFYIKTGGRRLAILPERHPETGERSLFPITKNEDGKWVIAPLLREELSSYTGNKSALLDADSFEVTIQTSPPKPLQ